MTKEQQLAVDTTDRAVIISANAGSGKTSTMVKRLISIISKHIAEVSEILALTFTRSASTEMRQRLNASLLDELNTSDDRQYIENQISELNVASICSLDSFCQNIIKKYFYTIDVDPNFAIIDAVEAGYLKSSALDLTMQEFAGTDEFRTLTQILKDTRKLQNISELVLKFSEFLFTQVNVDEYLKKITNQNKSYNACVKFMLERFKELVEHYEEKFFAYRKEVEQNDYVELKDNVGLACEFCEKFTNFSLDDMTNLKAMPEFHAFSRKTKGRSPEEMELQGKIKADTDFFKKDIDVFLQVFCFGNIVEMSQHFEKSFPYVKFVCELTRKYIEKYAELKKNRNVLDFTDLEDKAIEILRDPKVQSELRAQYKFVCVDEFQDTNEKQSALLSAICGENNTFFVGDPKQSIYKFRQCDLNIFVELIDKFKLDESKLAISFKQNFRSHKAILQFVNDIFDRIMTKQVANIDYKNENRFEWVNPDKYKYRGKIQMGRKVDSIDRVKVMMIENECKGHAFEKTILKTHNRFAKIKAKVKTKKYRCKKTMTAYSVIDSQNQNIKYIETNEGMVAVNYILEFFKKKIRIRDSQTHKQRRVRFSDFAILLRYRKDFKMYIDALSEFGIPVSAKDKINLVELPHIAMLVNCLRAISNPKQDLPLVASLKIVGKFDERELFNIRESHREGFFYEAVANFSGSEEIGAKLKAFEQKMENYRIFARNFSVSELLEKIIFETNYNSELLKETDGVDSVKQLNLFLSKLEGKTFNDSVDEFLGFIEGYKKAFEVDFSTVSSENSVKITTIHDSKGLEYPIVIVGGIGKNLKLSDKKDFMYTKELGLGCVYTDLGERIKYPTISQLAITMQCHDDEILEEMRVLYVALTRPKEYLALIGVEPSKVRGVTDAYSVMHARTFYDFIVDTQEV